MKLICGFFDPTHGKVLLDSKDIREFNRQDYYAMFSAVFQNFSLLAGTIAANVAQTEENYDMERIKDCAEKAGLTSKINSLKDGYQTKLNRSVYEDGAELSGGETQKLMLARALYKKAPFIILDEPTAALDPIAEADIYSKYNEMTKGCTSVYISHRLASTRFCDRILLIGNHKIAEEGTHEELLKLSGEYARLFEIQSKYYREGMSVKKDKKLLKWREAWKLNRRAFALIYKRCPHMIISRLVCVAWDALTPYIGIYLSALLITELTQRSKSVCTDKTCSDYTVVGGVHLSCGGFFAQVA